MSVVVDTGAWLCPDAVFDGDRLTPGLAIHVAKGRAQEVAAAERMPQDATRLRIEGIVAPGFIDLQVNGGGGYLLNATPDIETMQAIRAAHRGLGTTAILPTVITDHAEVLDSAVEAAIAAQGTPGIAGLHIEGPHLSLARRGTHEARFIRDFDARTLGLVTRLRDHGIPTLITVAPEAIPPAEIGALRDTGAVVSIGHTNATADTCRASFGAGARAVTHLFNAMSPMQNREAGVTGAAINSEAYLGIICDGVHVADEMVGLAFRARPVRDRMFLVSDAMPTVAGPDHFSLYGKTIHLENGRLVNAEGSLAGAHTCIGEGLARLVNVIGIAPEDALRAAITVPSRLMSLDLDHVAGRPLEELLVLDADMRFQSWLSDVQGALQDT